MGESSAEFKRMDKRFTASPGFKASHDGTLCPSSSFLPRCNAKLKMEDRDDGRVETREAE